MKSIKYTEPTGYMPKSIMDKYFGKETQKKTTSTKKSTEKKTGTKKKTK